LDPLPVGYDMEKFSLIRHKSNAKSGIEGSIAINEARKRTRAIQKEFKKKSGKSFSGDVCCICLKATGSSMSKCGRCKTRSYCSKACQALDWPEHKRVCIKLAHPRPLKKQAQANKKTRTKSKTKAKTKKKTKTKKL
jgi:hypothetical protein